VITFDDGWKSNFDLLPVIKNYDIPVTIFLATGLVDTHRKIWNYTIERRGEEKQLNHYLKSISNREKNKFLLNHNGYHRRKEYDDTDFLTMDEIERMSRYCDFQSHGQFHPVLPMCDDEELAAEIMDSREYIEERLGGRCYALAYPYGKYDDRVVGFVRDAGYLLARSINRPFLNSLDTNPYELAAIVVDEKATIDALEYQVAWAEFRTLARGRDVRG
jgi:peptidoglycan/xylan/chitin deacetylase (PgdA/CDA1 family)